MYLKKTQFKNLMSNSMLIDLFKETTTPQDEHNYGQNGMTIKPS